MKTSSPRTESEHAALRTFCARVDPLAKNAVIALRARGHRIDRAPWRGAIADVCGVTEAVIVITLWIDPESTERMSWDEARAAADMRDHLIHAGLIVGGVVCKPSEVWVRGPRVADQKAAE